MPEKYRLTVVRNSDPGVDRLGIKGAPPTGFTCIALRGTIGKWTRCKMYEDRPKLCRELERGSKDCLKERQQASIGWPGIHRVRV